MARSNSNDRSSPALPARLSGNLYWVCTATYNRWPLFNDPRRAGIVNQSFQNSEALQNKQLLAWVVLPDQAQWLFNLPAGVKLEGCVAHLKAASSRELNHFQGGRGPVWEIDFQYLRLQPDEDPRAIARRMIEAPVIDGLARDSQAYPFCHSVWSGC
ncbi:MAG: hypothetical protein GAK45_01889 [Pseudomonas citronellolis]|nr:MAG: hypothetical protein GAK45_01889 [Pseudomonas citronellolis]